MVKRHLKRLNAPKTWDIQRRGITFITRSNPGGIEKSLTTSISNILKYDLKMANTIKEVKYMIKEEDIVVNGRKITDYRHPVCFTDVLSFPKINQNHRMIIDTDGILKLVPVSKEESTYKILKIIGKSYINGKLQFNLIDGRNILLEKPHYKVNDSLVVTIPDNIVKDQLSLEKGSLVLLYRGKHIGKIATVEDIKGDSVAVKSGSDSYETKKAYVLVVGKDKPEIKMTK